jgi:hypothetical protein
MANGGIEEVRRKMQQEFDKVRTKVQVVKPTTEERLEDLYEQAIRSLDS